MIDLNCLNETAESLIKEGWKSLSDDDLYRIFDGLPHGLPFILDDAITFMKKYCKKGEKINFKTLNEWNEFENIRSCKLETLHDFISKYVGQNSDNSDHITNEEEDEMGFFAYLYRYIKIDGILLDDKNQGCIKYFIDRQENLLSRARTVEKFCKDQFYYIRHLAVGSLDFKDQMKQYSRQRSHKKRIEDKSKRDSGNKNRIKFIITSKNFSKTF